MARTGQVIANQNRFHLVNKDLIVSYLRKFVIIANKVIRDPIMLDRLYKLVLTNPSKLCKRVGRRLKFQDR